MTIACEKAGGIATITLDRPNRLNAFTTQMARAFIRTLDDIDQDNTVRAIIVTGSGRAFSAGADLSEAVGELQAASVGDVEPDFGGLMTLRIFNSKKPVIAAVNGPAVGIGATIQLAMDVRIASTAAQFGFVFVKLGLVPEAASSWFLPRIVGLSTALQWCMSGATVDADTAFASGLVSAVHHPDDLLDAARAIARNFMKDTAPASVALTRRMIWTMAGAPHPMDAHVLDSKLLNVRSRSSDLFEGIAAFLEKRSPDFANCISESDFDAFAPWLPRQFK